MKRSALPMLADHKSFTGVGFAIVGSGAGCGPEERPSILSYRPPMLLHPASATTQASSAALIPPRALSTEGIQAHANAFAERRIVLVRLVQRDLVGCLGLGGLLLRHEEVAPQGGVLRFVRRAMLLVEELQRVVIRVLVHEHGGETQPGEVAKVLRRRMIHDPLQLRLRALRVL